MVSKLLLVEDDPGEREVMVEAIRSVSDAEVIVASDGREALDWLRRNGPDTHRAPAAVFLDLGMPNVDGLEVLREFHRLADAGRVPVVVFTAASGQADVYLGYHLGAKAFVVKPPTPAKLREVARVAAAFWLHNNVRPPVP